MIIPARSSVTADPAAINLDTTAGGGRAVAGRRRTILGGGRAIPGGGRCCSGGGGSRDRSAGRTAGLRCTARVSGRGARASRRGARASSGVAYPCGSGAPGPGRGASASSRRARASGDGARASGDPTAASRARAGASQRPASGARTSDLRGGVIRRKLATNIPPVQEAGRRRGVSARGRGNAESPRPLPCRKPARAGASPASRGERRRRAQSGNTRAAPAIGEASPASERGRHHAGGRTRDVITSPKPASPRRLQRGGDLAGSPGFAMSPPHRSRRGPYRHR